MLLGDIYIYKGERLDTKQITERMNIINNMILNEYIDDTFCNICPIKIKRYFNINQIQYITDEFVDTLDYRIRGLYFVPLKCSYSKSFIYLQMKNIKRIIIKIKLL